MVTSEMVPEDVEVEIRDHSIPATELNEVLNLFEDVDVYPGSGIGVSTKEYRLVDDGDDDKYAILYSNKPDEGDYIIDRPASKLRNRLERAIDQHNSPESLLKQFNETVEINFEDVQTFSTEEHDGDGDAYVFAQLYRFKSHLSQSDSVRNNDGFFDGVDDLSGWNLNYFGLYEDIQHDRAPDIDGEGTYLFFLYEEESE